VNTVSFLTEGADSIAMLAWGSIWEGIWRLQRLRVLGRLRSSLPTSSAPLEWSRTLPNSLVRFSLGRESTLEEAELVRSRLAQVIHRAQRKKPQSHLQWNANNLFISCCCLCAGCGTL